jgi:hypothetical protein
LQETATKAMQTARLAKLLGKQQETRSPSPLPALAARLTRTFQPTQSGKTASAFCTTYKILTGAHLGKLLDEVAGGWWTNRNAIYWLVFGWCIIFTFFRVENLCTICLLPSSYDWLPRMDSNNDKVIQSHLRECFLVPKSGRLKSKMPIVEKSSTDELLISLQQCRTSEYLSETYCRIQNTG